MLVAAWQFRGAKGGGRDTGVAQWRRGRGGDRNGRKVLGGRSVPRIVEKASRKTRIRSVHGVYGVFGRDICKKAPDWRGGGGWGSPQSSGWWSPGAPRIKDIINGRTRDRHTYVRPECPAINTPVATKLDENEEERDGGSWRLNKISILCYKGRSWIVGQTGGTPAATDRNEDRPIDRSTDRPDSFFDRIGVDASNLISHMYVCVIIVRAVNSSAAVKIESLHFFLLKRSTRNMRTLGVLISFIRL